MGEILIGFEVGTGESVHIDPDHMLVTGLTQQTGKTTTLNALIYRSGRRAVAFRTKRGEIDMDVARQLQAFYKEPRRRGREIDWMYVKELLGAALERNMDWHEEWIMRACEGAASLGEVYENIMVLQEESSRAFDKGQYLRLEKYFEIILPQLEQREWATSLPLVKGVNLMDLEDLSFEMQCLVIERTMDHVLAKMKDVIVVLPEARKFIPLTRKTPVTGTAVRMAAEGAVLDLDLWVDSQTYSSVNNEVRKQCGTQIHGFQTDNNEANTIRGLLGKRWGSEVVKGLRLGHFLVKTKDKRHVHVYVLPAGVPEEMGRRVAMGELRPEAVAEYMAEKMAKRDGEEEMYREMYEESQRRLKEALAEKKRLEERLEGLRGAQTDAADVQKIREELARFEEKNRKLGDAAEAGRELRRAVTRFLQLDASPKTETTTAVDGNVVASLVDERLAQVLRESPPERVVSVDLSEAARELVREGFTSNMAGVIGGLTPEPRRAALIVREHGTIKTRDLYFHVRGKESRGRLPVNFNTMVKKLENLGLVARNANTGLVSWTLRDLVDGKLIDVTEEETRRQIEEYLASLLLPGSQG